MAASSTLSWRWHSFSMPRWRPLAVGTQLPLLHDLLVIQAQQTRYVVPGHNGLGRLTQLGHLAEDLLALQQGRQLIDKSDKIRTMEA